MSFQKGTKEWDTDKYRGLKFDVGFEQRIAAAGAKVLAGKTRYQSVQLRTRVPWFLIGAIHNMEASCDFRACLHNGERIIGTGRKTRLVPAGRGPFDTWESAALDAIRLNGMGAITVWNVGQMLYWAERFNGWGYETGAGRAEASPYLWSCSSVNDGFGKYTGDGHYDSNAPANGQVGVATQFKWLELNHQISGAELYGAA